MLYDDIGGRIKFIAKAAFYLGFIASIVVWVYCMFKAKDTENFDLVTIGIVALIVGGIASWVVSNILYGFGALVENSEIIARSCSPATPAEADSPSGEN